MKNQTSIDLTPVTNVSGVNLTDTFVANHNGTTYFGKFINADTGTFSKSTNFVWNGSIFPQGIPFECLDSVYAVNQPNLA
jgi:hypothetical protein